MHLGGYHPKYEYVIPFFKSYNKTKFNKSAPEFFREHEPDSVSFLNGIFRTCTG